MMTGAFHESCARIMELLQGQDRRDEQVVANRYRDLCEKANKRLRQCADYLRRGLIAEAVYHAETPPDLFELVPSLDFPNIAEWEEYCEERGLPRAPRLLIDVAQQLNKSFAVEDARRPLLRQMRLLALAGAPLRPRLQVLRALAALDPNCTLWDQDVQAFEQARVAEMPTELKNAVRSRSIGALQQLLDELCRPGWTVVIPVRLVETARRELQKARNEHALIELRRLFPGLDQAYMAMDLDRCREILNQCETVITEYGLVLPENQVKRMQPVQAWVAAREEERLRDHQFAEACAQLRAALEHDEIDPVQIRRLHKYAISFEQKISEELEQAYRSATAALMLKERRRTVRRSLAIGAAVVTGSIMLAVVFYQENKRSNRDAALELLTKSVVVAEQDPTQLREARNVWKTLENEKPEYAARQEFRDVEKRLANAERNETERCRRWGDLRAKIVQMLDEWKNSPGSYLPPDSAQWTHLSVAVSEARDGSAAILESELIDLRSWNGVVRDIEEARRSEADANVAKHTKDAEESLAKLQKSLGPEASPEELQKLKKEIFEIKTQLSTKVKPYLNISATNSFQVVSAKSNCDDLDRMVKKRLDSDKSSKAIWASIGRLPATAASPEQLADTLRKFMEEHPDSEQADDFRRALESLSAWKAVETWAQHCMSWNHELRPLTRIFHQFAVEKK